MTTVADMFWIAGGGAIGALCRFHISAWFGFLFGKGFPWGTLFVNAVGSFIMGLVMGGIAAACIAAFPWKPLVADGLLGALTTFSTFSMDTFAAFRDNKPGKACANILANLACCLGGTCIGFALAGQQLP